MLKVISSRGKNKAPRTKRGAEKGHSFHTVVRVEPEGGGATRWKGGGEVSSMLGAHTLEHDKEASTGW